MKRRSFFGAVGGFVGMLFGYRATKPVPPSDIHIDWYEQFYREDAEHGLILDIEGWPGTLTFFKIVTQPKEGNAGPTQEWLVAEREDGSAAVWQSTPSEYTRDGRPMGVGNISESFSTCPELTITKKRLTGVPIKEPVT